MYESVNRVLSWYHSYDLAGRTRRWRADHDRGASAVEYALVLAAIAAAVAFILTVISGVVTFKFNDSCQKLNSNVACKTAP
jgi:Flp pilus assembly pilin Flp